MEYSSLAEAQQQQYQQHQSDPNQVYDPSQAQAYAAYYAACDQYYAASAAYYQQPYYSHDYSSSSSAAAGGAYYTDAQPDSAPPQVDASQIQYPGPHGTAYAHSSDQDAYSYQAPPALNPGPAAAPMNPAAAAALSQLSQLTGRIDAAERAMSGMHDRPPLSHYQHYSHPMAIQAGIPAVVPGAYRGGGRRGSRGMNRGGPIGQLHFSGRRGRSGRGRGRRPPNSESLAAPPPPPPSRPLPKQAPKASQKSLLPVAWCDICRVDCNSLEILEQHRNGKRHKKTVQRVNEIQSRQKAAANHDHPEVEIEKDAVGVDGTPENAAAAETENNPQDSEAPAAADGMNKKRRMAGGYDRWRGTRGGKMMRMGRGHYRGLERGGAVQRPPRDRPRVCTVCNVMCDTMAVFECHLSGKKHVSRVKRFEGHGSVFGPISVYIPPNQPIACPNNGPDPLFYGLQTYEALQRDPVMSFEEDEEAPDDQIPHGQDPSIDTDAPAINPTATDAPAINPTASDAPAIDPTANDAAEMDQTANDAAETDPMESDAAETDPMESDVAETDPMESDAAETDPTESDAAAEDSAPAVAAEDSVPPAESGGGSAGTEEQLGTAAE